MSVILTSVRGADGWWLPSAGAAAAWIRARLRPGQRLAVRGLPSPDLAALIQGAWAAGVCLVPISHRLPAEAAAQLARRAKADLVLFDGVPSFPADADPRTADPGTDSHDPQTLGLLLFTSGTTGEPKAVRLSRRALRASAAAACLRLELTRDDHWCACLPLDHIGGIATLLRAHLTGFTVHLHARFDTTAVGADLLGAGDVRITGTSLVPTMLQRLMVADVPWPAAMRVLLIGGGPLDLRLAQRSLELGVAPCQTYGLSECASQVCTLAPDEAPAGLGTAGTPVAGMEVSLSLAGAIRVRGSSLMDGYEDFGDGAHPFDADGWFTTGDLGAFDAAGRLSVLGRTDEVIITGGEKVSPFVVEALLEQHPQIAEAGVHGEPDPEWGQRVCVVLVARGQPLNDDELRDVFSRLADFQRPKRWRWVAALPRTALGKLQRQRLPSAL